jgi:hypothetical protein
VKRKYLLNLLYHDALKKLQEPDTAKKFLRYVLEEEIFEIKEIPTANDVRAFPDKKAVEIAAGVYETYYLLMVDDGGGIN